MFSLFRLPLGAFRPHDLLYVYEDAAVAWPACSAWSATPSRDEWTIVELDAIGVGDAGDIRFRLVQQLLRDGAKRGAAALPRRLRGRRRQRGAAHAGGLRPLRRGARPVPPARQSPLPAAWSDDDAAAARDPARAAASTPLALGRLYTAATPAPVARLEACACRTGSGRGPIRACRVPASRRSCASPTSSRSCRSRRMAAQDGTILDGVHPGRRREGGSAALPARSSQGRSVDASALVRLRARHHRRADGDTGRRPSPRTRGHRARSRTYESTDRSTPRGGGLRLDRDVSPCS
ncbi:MAG: hypothetical protein WKF78_07240 [Candidatus Limnocylindrales bacterium]